MIRPRLVQLSDEQVLALSDACWWCLTGSPVEVRDGHPTCERCSAAFRETEPPPAPATEVA